MLINIKPAKKLTVASFIKYLFVAFFLSLLAIFVLTAAKIELVQSLENQAVQIWYDGVNKLPDNLQGIGLELGKTITSELKSLGLIFSKEAATFVISSML